MIYRDETVVCTLAYSVNKDFLNAVGAVVGESGLCT